MISNSSVEYGGKRDEFYTLEKEAEEHCLSTAIIAPHTIDRLSALITYRDFTEPILGEMWTLIVDMWQGEGNFDDKKFMTECVKRGLVQRFGGAAEIAKIIDKSPNYAMGEYYARELARLADIRRMESALLAAMDELRDPRIDPVKVSQFLMSRLEGIGNSKDAGFKKIAESVQAIIDRVNSPNVTEATRTFFGTGLPSLDRVIGGLTPGKLYLLGGRTGMGKSALACNIASRVADSGKCVWVASLEMDTEEITERIISEATGIALDRWRAKVLTEKEKSLLATYRELSHKYRLWFTEVGRESMRSVRGKVRLRKSLSGLDLVIIDNLQLMSPMDYKLPKYQQLKQLSEALKMMAKEMGIAVLVLCQLSVESEPGGKKRHTDQLPDNTSWADSKRIVDDADVAMILHRENKESAEAKLIITKHRGGREGIVPLLWSGRFQKFEDDNRPKEGY